MLAWSLGIISYAIARVLPLQLQLLTHLCTISKRDPPQAFYLVWDGPLETERLNKPWKTKVEQIMITFEISNSNIYFLDFLLFKDFTPSTLQYPTLQKLIWKMLSLPCQWANNTKPFVFHVWKPEIPIFLPPIWAWTCPSPFYKALKACSSI